eukprot:11675503-Prorocentrum_lima.AAC.1
MAGTDESKQLQQQCGGKPSLVKPPPRLRQQNAARKQPPKKQPWRSERIAQAEEKVRRLEQELRESLAEHDIAARE